MIPAVPSLTSCKSSNVDVALMSISRSDGFTGELNCTPVLSQCTVTFKHLQLSSAILYQNTATKQWYSNTPTFYWHSGRLIKLSYNLPQFPKPLSDVQYRKISAVRYTKSAARKGRKTMALYIQKAYVCTTPNCIYCSFVTLFDNSTDNSPDGNILQV